MFIFVRIEIVQLALGVVLLSKWRMLALKPRHWPANIRANAVDLMVGLAVLTFMADSASAIVQAMWVVLYIVWLLFIKPHSGLIMVSIQAGVGQLAALMAFYVAWPSAPLYGLVAANWAICYLAARHFFTSFEEKHTSLYAHLWGYFASVLVWVLGHWLLFYGVVSQPTLLLSVIGYGLATLYYLESTDKLSTLIRGQVILIMSAIVVVILVSSDWSDKAV